MADSRKRPVSWNAVTLVMINVMLAGLLVWAWARFGSVQTAFGYANGHRLFVDAASKSLGVVDAGRVYPISFTLKNVSNHSVKVIGAKTSCSCVATDDLPMTVHPHSEQAIVLKVHATPGVGKVNEKVHLYTNQERQTELVLNIDGIVLQGKR